MAPKQEHCLPCGVSRGPEGTPFDGGVFVTELIFPTDYPLSPPKMRFISDMFHPNGRCVDVYSPAQAPAQWCAPVYPDGRVCISILHTPGEDPLGYESATERWSPVQSIEKILLSVVSMLAGRTHPPHTSQYKHYPP